MRTLIWTFTTFLLLTALSCKKESIELPDLSGFAPEDCRAIETYINNDLFEEFLYDAAGKLERYNRYSNDKIYEYLTFEYDGENRLETYYYYFLLNDTIGRVYRYAFEYDTAGRPSQSNQYQRDYLDDPTEELVLTTTFEHDPDGRLSELTFEQAADPDQVFTQTFEYDERGNTTRVDYIENDELQSWNEYTYDDNPNRYSIFFELLTFLVQHNNQLEFKSSRYLPMTTNVIVEKNVFEYEYYENGLVKVQTSSTSSQEKKYKYACE
ncbi:MAG: hypothetical protein KDC43_25945 [Saprospiraceae bacterium]|nr:hypothetical protein [Saprospiraceae bacterium]MCB0627263.1 hypothetical protein [Saprospiraceae bacterium]MCB0677779.1 hypothetical protein [Saprospiraceae bacterium]MCB0683339.1 hypothetical protein [Saprospiraceae bacterium]